MKYLILLLLAGCVDKNEVRSFGVEACRLGYISAWVDMKNLVDEETRNKVIQHYRSSLEDKACLVVREFVK